MAGNPYLAGRTSFTVLLCSAVVGAGPFMTGSGSEFFLPGADYGFSSSSKKIERKKIRTRIGIKETDTFKTQKNVYVYVRTFLCVSPFTYNSARPLILISLFYRL